MRANRPEKLTLAIRHCSQSGAVYLGLREHLKVVATEVKQDWPLVTVDYAGDGRVIGIEAVGFREFTLNQLFQFAGIRLTAEMARNAIVGAERRSEAVTA